MAALTTAEWTPDATGEILDLSVGDLLRATAERAPDTPALVAGTPDPADRRRWSYAELLDDAERVARALLGRFAPGERVAVWATNIPEWVVLELGAGAGRDDASSPSTRRCASSELAHVLRPVARRRDLPRRRVPRHADGGHARRRARRAAAPARGRPVRRLGRVPRGRRRRPRALPERRPARRRRRSSTRPGRPGFPKGALLHHRGIVNNARLYARAARARPGRRVAQPDAAVPHRRLRDERARRGRDARARSSCCPRFDPALVLELVEARARRRALIGVPTMLIALLDHPDFADARHARRALPAHGRRGRAAGARPPRRGGVRRAAEHRVRADGVARP